MDAFVSRKRRRTSPPPETGPARPASPFGDVEESTDVKLAILSSLHPEYSHDDLIEVLLGCEGSVKAALEALSSGDVQKGLPVRRKEGTSVGPQSSLPSFIGGPEGQTSPKRSKTLTKKG